MSYNYRRRSYRKSSYNKSKGGYCRTCGRYQKNLSAHLRAYPSHKKRNTRRY